MTRASYVALLLMVPIVTLVHRRMGVAAAIGAGVVCLIVFFGAQILLMRREQRKLEAIVRAEPLERAKRMEALSDDHRAAVLLQLDEVEPAHLDPRAHAPRTFHYPRLSRAGLVALFLIGVALASLPAYLLAQGRVMPDQRSAAFWSSVIFAVIAGAVPLLAKLQTWEVRVSAVGVTEHKAFGKSVRIAWPELGAISESKVLRSLVIHSADGSRKISVGAHLQHFEQFVEALVAERQRMEEAARMALGDADCRDAPDMLLQ